MNREIQVGDYLEISGQLVGQIQAIDNKTLLVRKLKASVGSRNNEPIAILQPQAVFINKNTVKTSYWIRIVSPETFHSTIPVDLERSNSLISEFLNV